MSSIITAKTSSNHSTGSYIFHAFIKRNDNILTLVSYFTEVMEDMKNVKNYLVLIEFSRALDIFRQWMPVYRKNPSDKTSSRSTRTICMNRFARKSRFFGIRITRKLTYDCLSCVFILILITIKRMKVFSHLRNSSMITMRKQSNS